MGRSVTAGRAFAERSGTVSQGYGPKKASAYTVPSAIARADGKKGIGMAGGRSWTKEWLKCADSLPQRPGLSLLCNRDI